MKANGRRFNGKQSYPIPIWNGLLEHRDRMGAAIWEFIWCLDRITQEKNGVGIVSGGAPVRAKQIAQDFVKESSEKRGGKGRNKTVDEDTVRINLKKLEKKGYLLLRRTPYGQVIKVPNSRKFGIWTPCKRTDENPDSLTGESRKSPTPESRKTPETKKTQQTTRSKKEEEAPTAPLGEEWVVLGVDTPIGSPNFQRFWKSIYEHRNGQPLSRLMETCAQGWWATGKKKKQHVPPPFWEAKRRVEERERQEAEQGQEREMVKARVPA